MAETMIWQDENGVRTCPRCGTTFDGSTIGATPQAAILCSDCTLKRLDEKAEEARRGKKR